MNVLSHQNIDRKPLIPEDRFTTRMTKKTEQFAYWRALVAPIADVETAAPVDQGFAAVLRAQDLGMLQISRQHLDAAKYKRTSELIRRSNVDHWQIVLRQSGSEYISARGDMLRSVAGSLDMRSLALPSSVSSTCGDTINLWLKRENFSALSSTLDAASHKPIQGPLKNILREYIVTLDRYRTTLTVADVPAVVNSLTALLSAIIRPTRDQLRQAAIPITASRIEMARRYVNANLTSPTLGTEALVRELGVSRRKLYYMFEQYGGVTSFIRERRLAASHAALEDATDTRLVSTIAYDYGFADPAQFSRAFRSHFGYSPKDARDLGLTGNRVPLNAPQNFVQWLSQARRP